MTHAAEIKELSQQFVTTVLDELNQMFVGKEEIVHLLGVSLIAGENLFVLGPPGTAKSALVQQLAKRIQGNVFDYLLTRFTEPNEIFGPFDIRKLREGELKTNTEGMLPEAHFVFFDELLNANSAILNSLLMVLNERIFRRGRETRDLPTLMVVGASNRLPEDDVLNALFDRFLLRVVCDNVPEDRLQDVLISGWNIESRRESPTPEFHVEDVTKLQNFLHRIELAPIREKYVELVQRLRHAGIEVSDRRAVKLQRLFAASAILAGREHVNTTDFWVVNHIWDSIQQKEILTTIVSRFLEQSTEEEKEQSHPAARGEISPDCEQLAAILEEIKSKIEIECSDTDRSFFKDRIILVKQRAQWIHDPDKRSFIEDGCAQAISVLEAAS